MIKVWNNLVDENSQEAYNLIENELLDVWLTNKPKNLAAAATSCVAAREAVELVKRGNMTDVDIKIQSNDILSQWSPEKTVEQTQIDVLSAVGDINENDITIATDVYLTTLNNYQKNVGDESIVNYTYQDINNNIVTNKQETAIYMYSYSIYGGTVGSIAGQAYFLKILFQLILILILIIQMIIIILF